jgi:hypothetical protein
VLRSARATRASRQEARCAGAGAGHPNLRGSRSLPMGAAVHAGAIAAAERGEPALQDQRKVEPLCAPHAVLVAAAMSLYWYTVGWMKPTVTLPTELVVRTTMFCQAPPM